MRLKRLELRNWRNFLGSHKIEFGAAGGRNVTVIVGQNGGGKTALLNAFTWVLFEQTTAGFRRPDDLFNHAALETIADGDSARMEVRLEFEHDGADYSISRYQEATCPQHGGVPDVGAPVLSASRRVGTTEAISQSEINAILPPGLHPFFFFPAENIGKDIDQNDAASIRASMSTAIDVLLGIERYDKALAVVSKALADHLKPPRGARHKSLEDAESGMNAARKRWDETATRKRALPGLIAKQEELADKLKVQLDATAEYRDAMDEYARVKSDKEKAELEVAQAKEDQRKLVNFDCTVLFGHELFAAASDVLDDAHKNGEIPPKVSAGLLAELLDERNSCICGTPLGEGERGVLESLRAQTVDDVVALAASDLRGRVPQLAWTGTERRDEHSAESLLKHVKAEADAESKFRQLRNRELELINARPDMISHADPSATMAAWQSAAQRTVGLRGELTQAEAVLPHLEREKDEAERVYQKQLKSHADAKTTGRARELLANVEEKLATIQTVIRTAARRDVERAMNDVFAPLMMKDYRISLTDEFRYDIRDRQSGRSVGASSSEVALATFAFVGALAGLMPTYANLEQLLPKGDDQSVGGIHVDASGAYPVVLDAPYSPFGSDYSKRFSELLPTLLPQSVVIIREDQLPFVQPMLEAGHVANAYVLQLYSGKEQSMRIPWLNDQVDYVVNTDDQSAPHSRIAALPVE